MTDRELQLLVALKDAALGLDSVVRNLTHIEAALHKACLPSAWLQAIEPKLVRARDVIARAEAKDSPNG